MKKILPLVILLFIGLIAQGQNLVPNGDFEQYSSCPANTGQLDLCTFWMIPSGGTTDYLHQCATNFSISVPLNFYGYQNPHSGAAYCGIVGYRDPAFQTWREYAEIALTSPLIAGQCYHLEMHISLANNSGYTSDAIGAYFSNTAITGIMGTAELPFIPQIDINLGLNTDTLTWRLITGNVIASGGESYMIIGNFKSDSQTNALVLPGSLIYSFFFIDDVSLTPCTAIEEKNQNTEIKIYPNPVKDELFVNCYSLTGEKEIVIKDIFGKEVLKKQFSTANFKLQTSYFSKGIYFLEINDGKNVYRKKFLKL